MKQKKGIAIHKKLEAQTGNCFKKLPRAFHVVANASTMTETMLAMNESLFLHVYRLI